MKVKSDHRSKICCDDHSSLSSTTAVQIWIILYKLHIISKIRWFFNFFLLYFCKPVIGPWALQENNALYSVTISQSERALYRLQTYNKWMYNVHIVIVSCLIYFPFPIGINMQARLPRKGRIDFFPIRVFQTHNWQPNINTRLCWHQ